MTSQGVDLFHQHQYFYQEFTLSRGYISIMDKRLKDVMKASEKVRKDFEEHDEYYIPKEEEFSKCLFMVNMDEDMFTGRNTREEEKVERELAKAKKIIEEKNKCKFSKELKLKLNKKTTDEQIKAADKMKHEKNKRSKNITKSKKKNPFQIIKNAFTISKIAVNSNINNEIQSAVSLIEDSNTLQSTVSDNRDNNSSIVPYENMTVSIQDYQSNEDESIVLMKPSTSLFSNKSLNIKNNELNICTENSEKSLKLKDEAKLILTPTRKQTQPMPVFGTQNIKKKLTTEIFITQDETTPLINSDGNLNLLNKNTTEPRVENVISDNEEHAHI